MLTFVKVSIFVKKMSNFVKKCQKLWKIVKLCDKIPVFDALSPKLAPARS